MDIFSTSFAHLFYPGTFKNSEDGTYKLWIPCCSVILSDYKGIYEARRGGGEDISMSLRNWEKEKEWKGHIGGIIVNVARTIKVLIAIQQDDA